MSEVDVAGEPVGGLSMVAPQLVAVAAPRRPWVTWLAIAWCLIVFAGLRVHGNPDSVASLSRWGYRTASDIWRGQLYALLASAFIHAAPWHLAFNLYWLWLLGSRLEQAIGSGWYAWFYFVAAAVSSTAEVAFGGESGIGASGVVYAIFGFMWIASRRYDAFREVLPRDTIRLFLAWLVGCMVATYLGIWNVGNAAHLAGLLFGAGTAGCVIATSRRRLCFAVLCGAVVLALVPLVWCPWSTTWLSVQAYDAQQAGDPRRAIDYYGRILRIDPNNAWAYFNRAIAHQELNEPEQAAADLKQAKVLEPADEPPQNP